MTTSIVECPHCHYRFNYEFIPGASFTSIRLGPARIFKCPNCKELHKFNITHFGTDPSLPTNGDNAETSIGGKNIALIIGPLIVLVTIGVLLLITGTFLSVLVVIVPVVIGIVWLAADIAYLYRKASRDINCKLDEAK
jgi:hypothetical protein